MKEEIKIASLVMDAKAIESLRTRLIESFDFRWCGVLEQPWDSKGGCGGGDPSGVISRRACEPEDPVLCRGSEDPAPTRGSHARGAATEDDAVAMHTPIPRRPPIRVSLGAESHSPCNGCSFEVGIAILKEISTTRLDAWPTYSFSF